MKIILILLVFFIISNLKKFFIITVYLLGLIFIKIKLFVNSLYCLIFNKKSIVEEIQETVWNTEARTSASTYFLLCLKEYKEKLNSNFFNEYIMKNILKSIRENKDYIEQRPHLKDENGDVNQTAVKRLLVSMITDNIASKLETGKFHLYRGILDESGKELLKIYDFFANEILNLNMFDKETQKPIDNDWIERNRKVLLQNINEVG